MSRKYRPGLKSLSGLFLNFSAAWFGLAFITPNIVGDVSPWLLTRNVFFGIFYLLASIQIEALLEYE